MAAESCFSFRAYMDESLMRHQFEDLSLEKNMRVEEDPGTPCVSPGYTSTHHTTVEAQWMSGSSFSSTASSHRSSDSDNEGNVISGSSGVLSDHLAVSSKVLGSGQYGEVRACTDLTTGASLAIKSIKKGGADLREVKMEVEVMRRLQGGSGVVQLSRVVEDPDAVHLVMDLCEGGDLFDEIVRRERFAEQDAALLFAELAQTLAFCHSRGVVHRDLKPENILLTCQLDPEAPLPEASPREPITKLADFGLATTTVQGEPITGVAGSPFYIAPEVLTGEYNSKADVWSLGVILYVLLSGTHPFWGPNDSRTFESIRKEEPDLVSSPWNEVSFEAKHLIKRMLSKDPSKRPSAHSVLKHPWIERFTDDSTVDVGNSCAKEYFVQY